MRLRRSSPDEQPSPNLTPMIDVVFLLVIFFMVSTRFVKEVDVLEITLPQARTPATVPAADVTAVNITREGRFFLGEEEVSPGELIQALRQRKARDDLKVVMIRTDRDTACQELIRVMDAIRELGVPRIIFAVQPMSDE